MAQKVTLVNRPTNLAVKWYEDQNQSGRKYGDNLEEKEEIIYQLRTNLGRFLNDLFTNYPNDFNSRYQPTETEISFRKKINLGHLVDILLQILKYLEANGISWSMDDIPFTSPETVGIIRFDRDKKAIKLYHIKHGGFDKSKAYYGKTRKIV